MAEEIKNDLSFIETANKAVDKYHSNKENLISILMEVNQEIGFIPKKVMKQISLRMHIPQSQINSVASFYHMLFTKQTGRHVIKFCESAPCHVVGGFEVFNYLKNELKLEPGKTSDDGKWTLTTTSCFGLCSVGPVIMVDEDIYGNVTPNQIPDILAKYE